MTQSKQAYGISLGSTNKVRWSTGAALIVLIGAALVANSLASDPNRPRLQQCAEEYGDDIQCLTLSGGSQVVARGFLTDATSTITILDPGGPGSSFDIQLQVCSQSVFQTVLRC